MHTSTFTRPSALIPVAMSFAALAVVLVRFTLVGTARHIDEGIAAHLFQLLIVCQLPIVTSFAFKWLKRTPKQAPAVLGLQLLTGLVALAPVWYFSL